VRDGVDRKYSREWLQYERPQPMYDSSIHRLYEGFFSRENPSAIEYLDQKFKDQFLEWLHGHELSKFSGLEAFTRVDVVHGCTQYIDDLYQRLGSRLKTLKNDYKYHLRLNRDIVYFDDVSYSDDGVELLISMPFPYYGDVHPNMQTLLDKCHLLEIPVHIDAAWVSCIRDIRFNFDHPAIHTVGFSLSKGGLGGNRIGIRLSRKKSDGAVTLMNDFNMNSQALMYLGIEYMRMIGPEYFWKKYEEKYDRICRDFNLIPTKAIHLAKETDGRPVGIRALLRAQD